MFTAVLLASVCTIVLLVEAVILVPLASVCAVSFLKVVPVKDDLFLKEPFDFWLPSC